MQPDELMTQNGGSHSQVQTPLHGVVVVLVVMEVVVELVGAQGVWAVSHDVSPLYGGG